MKKQIKFMLDLETDGVNYKQNSILEIGIVAMEFKNGYWHPLKDHFHRIMYSSKQPSSEFARKYQKELYEKCNKSLHKDLKKVKKEMFDFFKNHGVDKPEISFAGYNVGHFDLPFMHHNDLLIVSRYNGEQLISEYDYTPFEIGGILHLFSNHLNLSIEDTYHYLKDQDPVIKDIPKGSEHTAIYDNYIQIKVINGALSLLKGIK